MVEPKFLLELLVGLFSNRASFVNDLFYFHCRQTGVTVLSAVG